MPLIVITGIPCSGKSSVTKAIKEHLETQSKKVLVVSEDEILERNGDDRNVTLSDSIKEKTLRSELKGQVLRHLTKDTVVILDALNYIKGYRYELYCASKSLKQHKLQFIAIYRHQQAGPGMNQDLTRKINGQKKHLMP